METNKDMKTLQECQNELSKKYYDRKQFPVSSDFSDEAAELYAQQFKDEIKRLKEENERLVKIIQSHQIGENLDLQL